jgi:hypothetical protein
VLGNWQQHGQQIKRIDNDNVVRCTALSLSIFLIFKTNLPTALSSVAETKELLATTRTIRVVGKDYFVRHTNKKQSIMTTWCAAPRCHYRFSLI